MFYEIEVKGHVRVPPILFKEDIKEAITKELNKKYDGTITKLLGVIMGVTEIVRIGEGIIIPGDGAAYYDTQFKVLAFRPELQEVVPGKVMEISDFGAFVNIGPLDGMVHISQAMDDYVSFSKSNSLTGKESKRTLKIGDMCRARIIAVSYKDMANPKIGLTMRQPGLGKEEWLEEDKKKKEKESKKEEKETKKK
ncbi:MAG: DNA-directed RNA polymerase [Nanoarchaeota archaeon]